MQFECLAASRLAVEIGARFQRSLANIGANLMRSFKKVQIDSETDIQKSFKQLQEKLMPHRFSLPCKLFDEKMSREAISSAASQHVHTAAANQRLTGHEGMEVK